MSAAALWETALAWWPLLVPLYLLLAAAPALALRRRRGGRRGRGRWARVADARRAGLLR